MDPDQNKTPDQNVPIPETSTVPETNNSYMDNVNKPQTPAFNDTDYWNQKTEEPKANITEPVNPPEPLGQSETETPSYTEPGPEPATSTVATNDTTSQNTDPAYQKWEDPPAASPETPSPSEPVSPPPSASEPTKSNTLTVVMVVLVALLLGATALFAFQNSQLKKQATAVVSPSPTYEATPSATPDPYANWKTYTNTKYGYSLKYPMEATIKSVGAGSNPTVVSEISRGIQLKLSDTSFLQVEVDGTENLSRGTYESWLSTLKKNQSYKVSSESTTTIGDITATVLEGTSTIGGKETFHKNYFFQSPDQKNFLSVITEDSADKQNGITFGLILSTIKFTSASPSPAAAGTCEKGYKAFSGEGYSLCYPETLVKAASTTSGQVVFENSNETLKITQNFQGGWGGSQCLFIDKTTVSGYASKRLSWKTEQATGGGCDNTYTAFAEMVNEGNFKFPFPYALELTAKKAPFQDNSQFMTIEKSFQVTNPNPSPNGS